MAYYGSGGGGGTITFVQHTIADEYLFDVSYVTGGVSIDLTKTFAFLTSFDVVVKKGTRPGTFNAVRFETTLNNPDNGKVKLKMIRKRYDRTSTVGNVSSPPAGITVQAASGVVTSSENAHTHSISHDHGSFASAANANNGGGIVLLDALGPFLSAHTHNLDLPNLVATSGAGSSHNHQDNSIYEHGHGVTQTSTNYVESEFTNGISLGNLVLYILATGNKL